MGADSWPWDISNCQIGAPWPTEIQEKCADDPSAQCETYCQLDRFLEFFDQIGRDVMFIVIGPGAELSQDDEGAWQLDVECNEQNSNTPMLEFYLWATKLTGGLYAPINVRNTDNECVDANFSEVLGEVGRLVSSL